MKVYVVIITTGVWCDFCGFEIFSTKEKAQDFINAQEDNTCFLYEKEVM